MDTNLEACSDGERRGPYRHHSREFKRAVVEQTLARGASVARVAREHGLNANQVFSWRRQFRAGGLDGVTPALLAVDVVEHTGGDRRDVSVRHAALLIETARGRLHIVGRPDAATLRLVLDQLLR